MNVLIIDDDKTLRYMLGEICKYAGWAFVTAANGEEGLASFEKDKPDVVLVDYHMPVMDGYRTLTEIRKRDYYVPVIVLTVDERQEVADKFLKAGATDFALKPVRAPDIIARIQLHMRLVNMQKVIGANEQKFSQKGISKPTLSHLEDYMKSLQEPASVSEISDAIGLAYPTVYRYMMHLLELGKVEQDVSYQKVGRPKNLYRWISA